MATLVRWEPFRDLAAFQGEVSRLLHGLYDGPGTSTQTWVPPLDVWETETDIVYAFDFPGIDEKSLTIEVHEDTLTVSGSRERTFADEGDGFRRFERRIGTFSRSVGLPAGVDETKIRATFVNGELEVRVPKPEEVKPRKIQVGLSKPDVTIDVADTADAA